MKPVPYKIPPEILELRAAMERVRYVQEVGGIAVNLARYDAETDEINQAFLTEFIEALPMKFGYLGNYRGNTKANHFQVKDPLDVRITATFGLFLLGRFSYPTSTDAKAALIIGEKTLDSVPATTGVLTVGWQRDLDDNDRWMGNTPRVVPLTVLTEHWQINRDRAINNIHRPYSSETLMGLFNSQSKAFQPTIEHATELGVTVSRAWEPHNKERPRVIERNYRRHFANGAQEIACVEGPARTLRSTDFEEYDVMRHLEYIAAGYNIGGIFDSIKASRDASMPTHPVEKLFDLQDYRRVIEQPSVNEIDKFNDSIERDS